jgi:putative FmdB family regulatory protein
VPTYQYACTACDHRFEAVQSFTDASLTECPACSGNLRKVFSSVGIVFKGSGFYRTDSRSGGGGVPAKSESAKSDSAKSDSGKSDASSSSSGSKESSSSAAPAA